MCSCMPSYSAYIRRHMQTFRQLKSHIRASSSWTISLRKQLSSKGSKRSGSEKIGMVGRGGKGVECDRSSCDGGADHDAHNHPLTLGSVIRDGRFLKTGDRSQFVRSQHLPLGDPLRSTPAAYQHSGQSDTQTIQSSQSDQEAWSSSGGCGRAA